MARAIIWFRRDLRLHDNPALAAALADGHEPIPLYIHAPDEEASWAPGAASRAWLARSLRALDADLRAHGSQLLVLKGDSDTQLQRLIDASGAVAVYWNRLRSEEHTSELQSLMRISYAVFCLKKKNKPDTIHTSTTTQTD